MSELERLIQELCPNGVEYRSLDSLIVKAPKSTFGVGQLSQFYSGDVICFTSGAKTFFVDKVLVDGEYIFMNDGGQADTKYYNGKACYSDHVFSFTSNIINVKYLYHYLLEINDIINQDYFRGAGIKNLVKKDFLNIKVPVPPMEVQSEIVRILDNFTLLTAELTAELAAELAARKEQYEYYRDKLLTFDVNIPKVKLGDIATDIYRGSGITREMVTEAGIPCVRYGEIYTKYNLWFDTCVSHTKLENVQSPKYFEYGDILFAITGESIEDIAKSVAYVGNEKCLAGGDIVVLKHKQNPKYISLVLSTTDAVKQKGKDKVKSKVVHSIVPAISEIEIPLPSLEVQERLVNVLENFESLCNELGIGLPAEIEARKQQYEFYRTKLLTMLSEGVDLSKQAGKIDRDIFVLAQYVFGFVAINLKYLCKSIKDGMHNLPSDTSIAGDYPVLSAQNINEGKINFKAKKFVDKVVFDKEKLRTNIEENDILLTIVATIGRTALVEKNIEFLLQRSVCVLKTNELIIPKYLKYCLDSKRSQEYMFSNAHGAAQKGLYLNQVENIVVFVPSIDRQKKIADILDKFEEYCTDISKVLPAEIELRQKQYEYYRNKLLTFKEL